MGGADVKTVQALARHCDPRITMNVYARSRRETLAKATEALGGEVLSKPNQAPFFSAGRHADDERDAASG